MPNLNDATDAAITAAADDIPLFRDATKPQVSVYDWFTQIRNGADPLPWEQQDRDRYDPDRQAIGPHPVGGANDDIHVYEFRAVRQGLPAEQWETFALHVQAYVEAVNQGQRGYNRSAVPEDAWAEEAGS